MIKSMTGFGRCEAVTDECKISVEIKAVNHRYLDLSIKMPKKFNYFEAAMRTLLKDYIQRGKVDVFITYEDYTEDQVSLKYNSTLAAEYMKNFEKMAEQFGLEEVNVVPQPKARGSFGTTAYKRFDDPVAVESLKQSASAGMDIGGTLIGMHIKPVVVPLRIETKKIGEAVLLCARRRPKFVGGSRAVYNEKLL